MKFILAVLAMVAVAQATSYTVLQRIMINKFVPVFEQMDTTMTGFVKFDDYNQWMKAYYTKQGYAKETVKQYEGTFRSNFKEMSAQKTFMSMNDVEKYVLKKYIWINSNSLIYSKSLDLITYILHVKRTKYLKS